MLKRISDVYKESRNYLFANPGTSNRLANTDSAELGKDQLSEIEGNYFLYFNEIFTGSTIRRLLKQILKILTWPILKRQVYFNSAVKDILSEFQQKISDLITQNNYITKRVTDLEHKVQQLSTQQLEYLFSVNETVAELEQKVFQLSPNIECSTDKLYKTNNDTKPKSELGFNEIIVGYRDEVKAYWGSTNERILEKGFVLQALARLSNINQLSVLDVSAAESLLSYELASLNYSVTAIDTHPIALSHPNLKFVKTDICKPVLPLASFDCVVALSVIEHIGLGAYGNEAKDKLDYESVKQINRLLKPGGSFILTIPYGKRAVTPIHRIYDRESLRQLIEAFEIEQIIYGLRLDNFTWTITSNEAEASFKEYNPTNQEPNAVAMIVCKKSLI